MNANPDKASRPLRILMVTSEWPTEEHPEWVPFLVRQAESLRRAGAQVQVFPFRGGKHPLRYLRAWWRLRRQYRLADFDILHAQFGQSGLVALPSPVPVVVTLHGSDFQGYIGDQGRPTLSGKILKSISKVVAALADEVIVVSADLARRLKRNAHILPCGVDFDLFQPMDKNQARLVLGWPPQERIVLFVGDPANPIKRFSLAQEVVKLVSQEVVVTLYPVSGVPHEQVPFYLSAADVLLVTSKHEGSPTIIKEALACNLPVVSVDVGDIQQQIAHIEGCALCEDDSPAAIALNLSKVIARNQRIQGREVIRDLDESLIAQKIIAVYRSVLS